MAAPTYSANTAMTAAMKIKIQLGGAGEEAAEMAARIASGPGLLDAVAV